LAVRVLIVDDSATARAVVREVLESDKEIEVVGVAQDAYIARDKIIELRPDVICLDVEMPRMDGITFLKKLMTYMPTPVVMVSSLTQKGAMTTLEALEAGAVDFVAKPHSNIYDGIDEIREEIVSKVKSAAKAKVMPKKQGVILQRVSYKALSETTDKVIAIGASTGGTEAIKDVLTRLPANTPGIIIVQHMPSNFTKSFADRLNELCAIEVKEAKNGDFLGVGKALVAPGDFHMVLRRSGARYYVEIGTGEKVSGHRPSVDVMFNSVAKTAGTNAIGVILTGMGADGAKGLLAMRNAGAKTIGQNEDSCIVYGMPKVAYEVGAVEKQYPLDKIAEAVVRVAEEIK
jgi:two-component system, chemotaxis family, protein-glutamate methylesterase/glutaminase